MKTIFYKVILLQNPDKFLCKQEVLEYEFFLKNDEIKLLLQK
jgi:hypothetical protein